MDESKHKAAILGDLARLKSTWGKVEEWIAEAQEAAKRERERGAEEARKAREAEIQRRENRRVEVRRAMERLVTEVGGFVALEAKASFARVQHEATMDTVIVNEGPGQSFLVFVEAADNRSRESADTTDLSEPLSADAVLERLLSTLIRKNMAYLPKNNSQEGRIL